MKLLAAVVFLATVVALTASQSLDDCLRQDSISCVQKSLYRKAKEFFERDNFDILAGVSLVKAKGDARTARTQKKLVYEQEIDAADNVVDRQSALENFVGEEVGDFLTGRSLKINFAPVFEKIGESARAIGESVPQDIRQAVDDAVEGRGKKKLLQKLLPLIIAAVKLKLSAIVALAYFAIALIAKKAIFASLVSIAISAFLGIKALLASKQSSGHDVTAYNGGWNSGGSSYGAPASGGWSSSASAGWDDHAQNQAYSGYHH